MLSALVIIEIDEMSPRYWPDNTTDTSLKSNEMPYVRQTAPARPGQ
jgi:hypothetical protein